MEKQEYIDAAARQLMDPDAGDATVVLADDGQRLFEKEILRTGSFRYRGMTTTITRKDLKETVDNFYASDAPVAYVPFQFSNDSGQHTDDPGFFQGVVKDLKLADDGNSLRAVMQLEPDAERVVLANPKFGVSVSLDRGYRRPRDGKFFGPTLIHVAGVHRPHLGGLANWVALSETNPKGEESMDEVAQRAREQSEQKEIDAAARQLLGEETDEEQGESNDPDDAAVRQLLGHEASERGE